MKRCITGHKAEWHVRRAQQFCYSLDGKRLREVSEKDLEAYTHVLNRPGLTARSPADLKRIGL